MGDLSSPTLAPLSFPLSESPDARTCLPDVVLDASSLTRLLAALMACLVPIMVPLPGLLLTAVVVVLVADVLPDGGRLALAPLVTGCANDLVEELRPLELLADSERALFTFVTPNVLGLTLAFACPGLPIPPGLPHGDGGEVAMGVLDELEIPKRGIDLLDLLLLLPKLAPLFSLLRAGLEPDRDRLSHLSRDM